jgi:hypothetical protein
MTISCQGVEGKQGVLVDGFLLVDSHPLVLSRGLVKARCLSEREMEDGFRLGLLGHFGLVFGFGWV